MAGALYGWKLCNDGAAVVLEESVGAVVFVCGDSGGWCKVRSAVGAVGVGGVGGDYAAHPTVGGGGGVAGGHLCLLGL